MYKGLLSLALGTFALGMAEFSMMGILSDVAREMDISISRAGDFISAYAIGVAVGSSFLLLLRKASLTRVLVWLSVVIIAGNIMASVAANYTTLLAGRFISGLPHGAYFGTAAIVASRISPSGKGAEAVAIMVAGMSVANVIGVPVATLMSALVSWRIAFVAAAFMGLLAAISIGRLVPDVYLENPGTLKSQFGFLRSAAPWLIFAATFLGQGSIYCWYSYVEPVMTTITGFSYDSMTFVMMLAGSGLVAGGLLAGRLADRYRPSVVTGCITAATIVVLPLIYLCAPYKIPSLILLFIATASLFGIGGPLQFLIIRYSKGGEMLGGAGIQIAFNTSNALAAALGGAVINAGFGLASPALAGIPLAIAATAVLIVFTRRYSPGK